MSVCVCAFAPARTVCKTIASFKNLAPTAQPGGLFQEFPDRLQGQDWGESCKFKFEAVVHFKHCAVLVMSKGWPRSRVPFTNDSKWSAHLAIFQGGIPWPKSEFKNVQESKQLSLLRMIAANFIQFSWIFGSFSRSATRTGMESGMTRVVSWANSNMAETPLGIGSSAAICLARTAGRYRIGRPLYVESAMYCRVLQSKVEEQSVL